MYYSIMRELNEEQNRELEKLSSPEYQGTNHNPKLGMIADDRTLKQILALLLKDEEFARYNIPLISPKWWDDDCYQAIFGSLAKHWTEFNRLPDDWVLINELREIYKDRPPEIQLAYPATVRMLFDFVDCEGREYLSGKVREFAAKEIINRRWVEWHENGMKVSDMDVVHLGYQEALNILDAAKNSQISWDEMEATLEQEAWLLPDWLEFGSLGFLCGDPFAGKSHLTAEIIAGIVKYGTFGPYDVAQCPILLCDAENKRRSNYKRIITALEGDKEPIRNLFSRLNTAAITLPWPIKGAVEKLREEIRKAKAMFASDRIFVIVDTMRSVFGADEMETQQMKDLLYPLQRMAQEENAAILVLHHRPKSGATYGGQTAIAGAADYLWLWETDDSMVGTLSLIGTRGDRQQPVMFKLENGRNRWQQGAKPINHLPSMLEDILANGKKMSQADLAKEVKTLWKLKTGEKEPGRDKIRDEIEKLVGLSLVKEPGEHNTYLYSMFSIANQFSS